MKKKAKQYKASEGRRSPRLLASFLMKYFLFDGTPGENVARTANTRDLSLTGIRFVTSEQVPENALLRTQVLVPVLSESPITFFARVLRVKREAESVFEVSADFLEIREDDQKRLRLFMESRMRTREAGHLFTTGTVFARSDEPKEKTNDGR